MTAVVRNSNFLKVWVYFEKGKTMIDKTHVT